MFWSRKPDPLFEMMMEQGMELNELDKEAGELKPAFDRVVKMYELRSEYKRINSISRDTLLIVGANLLGIILVIRHEHVGNFISSRAMGMVLNPRTPKS